MQDTASALPVLRDFVASGLMPDPRGLAVWDLGCGSGGFAEGLAALGAASVLATDLVLSPSIRSHSGIAYVEGGFDAVAVALGDASALQRVDFVFMHLVSEHIDGPKPLLRALHGRLRPRAEVLIHHDNYFQPAGHHDHGLVALNERTWCVEPRGVACWRQRCCDLSEDHRSELRAHWPQLWSEASEATRDPARCQDCNYFRRSQPWAHLKYGSDLRRTFPEVWFREQLNRLTPRQLTWDVQDAGFSILAERRSWVMNETPPDLVRAHGMEDLSTFTITLRLRRT